MSRLREYVGVFLRSKTAVGLFFAVPVSAGVITGTVLDPRGFVVPSARVALTCPYGRESTRTDYQGRFGFTRNVQAADCAVSVTHSGFELFKQAIGPDTEVILIKLSLAKVREVVNVVPDQHSEEPLKRSTLISISLSAAELENVSNNTADMIRYAKLLAGTAPGSDLVYVDGLPSSRLPPAEMVARIEVNADPFSAEYADGDNTHVDIITKSGDRKLRFTLGDASLGTGGHNVLAPNLRSESRWLSWSLMGAVPRLPLTFSINMSFGYDLNDVPIRAIVPTAAGGDIDPIAQSATAENRTLAKSFDVYYSGSENLGAHLSHFEYDGSGSNVGVGALTMPDAGFSSHSNSWETRATLSRKISERLLYRGGFVTVRTHSDTRANSEGQGLIVPGYLVAGGAQMKESEPVTTTWIVKNAVQSNTVRLPWALGLTISGSHISNRDVPNASGGFTFDSLQAYTDALAGKPTGKLLMMRGNGEIHYDNISAAPFLQKELLRSTHALINGGLRADYQSKVGVLISPRLSVAAHWRGFVFRTGGGLFAHNLPSKIFIKALEGDGFHLQEFLANNVRFDKGSIFGGLSDPAFHAIRSRLAADLTRPREIMLKGSLERPLGNLTVGVEHTWIRDWHLLGSRRLGEQNEWVDIIESNRSAERHRFHAQLRYKWKAQSLAAHYERTYSHDDSDGPFSFPAQPNDLRAEWARSAGISPHTISLVGTLTLPAALSFNVIAASRSSAPYNITTGLDTTNNGLYNDRGARLRNSGNGPAYNSLSLYGHRRIPIPHFLVRSRSKAYLGLGIHVENLLGNKNYIAVGSVVASPTFGAPLAGFPGRSVRWGVNLN